MQLQKRVSRKYKGKTYYKYLINLPKEIIEKAELQDGDNFAIEFEKHKIIIKKILN